MQILTLINENMGELIALWATTQLLLGGIGRLLSKFPKTQKWGHRLEAIGADTRKLVSGKSRTTDTVSEAIKQAVKVEDAK